VSGLLNAGGAVVVAILAVIGLLASVDAARRPQAAWHAVGARKWLWVVGMLVGTYFLAGMILVMIYLGGIRKDLQAVQAQPGN
jgi:NADH:ubiquinone oxidoreductase subunit 6 (subunit J)